MDSAAAAGCRSRFHTPAAATSPLGGIRLPMLVRTAPSARRSPSRVVVASAQPDFMKVAQTVWRAGKGAVDAGTSFVPASVPRPIARIGVVVLTASVALSLLKSVIATAFFALAMMGLIYFGFLAMNPKEGSRVDDDTTAASEDPAEEARRIMEKYK